MAKTDTEGRLSAKSFLSEQLLVAAKTKLEFKVYTQTSLK